ncbi:RHS repeat-associated core domain-containing protein [Actinoplanes sp. CA-131856]
MPEPELFAAGRRRLADSVKKGLVEVPADSSPTNVRTGPSLDDLPHAQAIKRVDPPLGTASLSPRPVASIGSSANEIAGTAALSDHGVEYGVSSTWITPPTYQTAGMIWLRIVNRSSITWRANQVSVGYHLYLDNDALYNHNGVGPKIDFDLPPNYYTDLQVVIQRMPSGTFKLVFDLRDDTVSGSPFFTTYGQPASAALRFTVPHYASTGTAELPTNGATVDTLRPTFYVRVFGDAQSATYVRYAVCREDNSSDCIYSISVKVSMSATSFTGLSEWTIPLDALDWNTDYTWKFLITDEISGGTTWSAASGFTTVLANPSDAAHLGADPGALDATGVNLYLGNYARSDIDLALPSPDTALPLRVERTYNSANTKAGAFGTGWTSLLDIKIDMSVSRLAIVRFSDGRERRYGQNPDDTWASSYGDGGSTTLRTSEGFPVVAFDDGTELVFAGAGNALSEVRRPGGNVLKLTVNPSTGRATKLTSARSSRSLYFSWVGSHVTAVSTAAVPGVGARTWSYTYSGDLLNKVCDAEFFPKCVTYTYGATDSSHVTARLTVVQRPNSTNRVSVGYAGDRVSTYTVPLNVSGTTTNWFYEKLAPTSVNGERVVRVVDPNGTSVYYEYNDRGQLILRWAGSTTPTATRVFTYDAFGSLSAEIDENWNSTEYTWSASTGRLKTILRYRDDNTLVAESFTYRGDVENVADRTANDLVATKDANSSISTLTYWNGLVTSQTTPSTAAAPNGATTKFVYTCQNGSAPPVFNDPTAPAGALQPCGLLSSVTDATGRGTYYGYNRFGDRTSELLPTNARIERKFNDFGEAIEERATTLADPLGTTATFDYDTHGRVTARTEPRVTNAITGESHQRVVINTYDGDGNLVSQREGDNNDPEYQPSDGWRTTQFTYDGQDRQLTVSRDGQQLSRIEYDGMGHVVRMVDAQGADYRHTYNALGLLASVDLVNYVDYSPGGTTRQVRIATYQYDPAGRTTAFTNAMGRTVTSTYTKDDLPLSETLIAYLDPSTGQRRDVKLHRYSYDMAGNRIGDVSGNGADARATSWTYDAANHQTSMTTDPSGLRRTTTWTYDAAGRVLGTSLSDGSRTETSVSVYDNGGQLAKTGVQVDANNYLVTQYTHDGFGQLLSVTEPRGVVSLTSAAAPDPDYTTTFTYDEGGRLTNMSQPPVGVEEGNGAPAQNRRPLTTFAYNTFGDVIGVRDPRGLVTSMMYDTRGRLTNRRSPQYIAPNGEAKVGFENWTYDNADNIVSYTGRNSQTTGYRYDNRGRLFKMVEPPAQPGDSNAVTDYTYDDNDNVLSVTDPAGGQTAIAYDEMDRPLVVSRASGSTASQASIRNHSYDDFGDLTSVTMANVRIDRTYNKAGELLSDTVSGRGTTRYTHDLAGRVVTIVDPLSRSTKMVYDLAGRMTSIASLDEGAAKLGETLYTMDKAGNVVEERDPRGNTWRRSYDAANRLIRTTDPAPSSADGAQAPAPVTSFGYDAKGNLTRTTDANYHTTYRTYNVFDLTESVVEPETRAHPALGDRTWRTTYDSTGNIEQLAKPGGAVVNATYDSRNRITSLAGTGGAAAASKTIEYDPAGRVTAVSTATGTQSFTYDRLGQLLAANGPMGNSSYTYDPLGRPITENNGTSQVKYSYNGVDLRAITDEQTGMTRTLERDAAGQILKESSASTSGTAGPERSYTYDGLGRIKTDTTTGATGAVTATIAYDWDANGNLTSRRTDGQIAGSTTQNYTYDQDDRLTRVADPAGSGTDFTWDAVGNRTKMTAWSGAGHAITSTTNADYDERNRLTAVSAPGGATEYTWTAQGTLANTATTTGGPIVNRERRYDAFDRLINDGTQIYTYDGLNRLATTTTGTTSQTMRYSGQSREPVGDGRYNYARTLDGDLLSAKPVNGASSTLMSDAHGDIVAAADPATGEILASRGYDAFGKTTDTNGTMPNIGFQGSWTDPTTGTISAQARWYEPTTGTFASRDSWDVPFTSASDTNRYLFGGANPTSRNDPTGHLSGVGGGALLSRTLSIIGGLAAPEVIPVAATCVWCWVAVGVGVVVAGVVVVGIVMNAQSQAGNPNSWESNRDPDTGQLLYGSESVKKNNPPRKPPRTDPSPKPVEPPRIIDPPKVWTVTGPTTSWSNHSQWYDDTYLYNRTDTYSYTTIYQYTYYDGVTSQTGTWNTETTHRWTIDVTPLIDLSNPIDLPTPTAGDPQPGLAAPTADDSVPCGQGGGLASCITNTGGVLPGSQAAAAEKAARQPAAGQKTDDDSSCDDVNPEDALPVVEDYAELVSEANARPNYRKINQTVAVLAVCERSSGDIEYYVGGRTDLDDVQWDLAEDLGLTPVEGGKNGPHAEPLIINKAKADALADPVNPLAIYAVNPFCGERRANCFGAIEKERGINIVPPTGRRRASRSAYWNQGTVWP